MVRLLGGRMASKETGGKENEDYQMGQGNNQKLEKRTHL